MRDDALGSLVASGGTGGTYRNGAAGSVQAARAVRRGHQRQGLLRLRLVRGGAGQGGVRVRGLRRGLSGEVLR
ncbi:cysteine-rich repeat secretory protein 12-like [Iris pallida]|uniref:Cysteine-rich repeat secretory protein 12-like n=1 Tax=Iris pallida TaxID=29817 RepID=A0AAX6FW06_IRIPA|nr:cysteine-rich repeat secretory protein 12-like [Iris pallida]